MGCVIAIGSRVIAVGWNQVKTHTQSNSWGHYLHAEIHALLGLRPYDMRGSTMYVCRVRKGGDMGMSKPCAACQAAIRAAGIKQVVYTNAQGLIWSYKPGEENGDEAST